MATTSSMDTGDIEIRIEPRRQSGYPIKIFDQERLYAGHCSSILPHLDGLDLQEDGEALMNWLLSDSDIRTAWGEIKGRYPHRRVIRLWIDDEAPELHLLPWEVLHEGRTPLAATDETPFSRYLMSVRALPRPALHPIKILVAIAATEGLERFGLAPINPREERAELEAILQGENVQTTFLEGPCTLSALNDALAEDYHILHLVAHGVHDAKTDTSCIILADDNNRAQLVVQQDFVDVFEFHMGSSALLDDRSLRLVYLSSCLQAKRSSADAFSGIGAQLVKIGIPAVIAMQDVIPIEVARQFSSQFYRNVLRDGRVDLACNRARAHVVTMSAYRSGITSDLARQHSAVPVLMMHRKDGWLWDRAGFTNCDQEDTEWNLLAASLKTAPFTIIIGPNFSPALLGSRREIARRWAKAFGFPLSPEGQEDLPQVAQYLAVKRGGQFPRQQLHDQLTGDLIDRFPELAAQAEDLSLDELLSAAGRLLQAKNKHEPYSVIAQLPVPIYVTTNPTSMLIESLRAAGKDPIVACIPWNDEAAKLSQDFRQEAKQARQHTDGLIAMGDVQHPSIERPLVYYLFGHLQRLDSVVLTEDDYFDFLINTTRRREVIPVSLRSALNNSNLMFLGFGLEEWAFRVIFRTIEQARGKHLLNHYRHVAAQVNPQMSTLESIEKAKDYLGTYFSRKEVSVYWGSVADFLTELQRRLPQPVIPD